MTAEHNDRPEVAQRRYYLRKWLIDNFEGSQSAFLATMEGRGHEMNQGELSGLLKKKSFGEKKARSLEEKAGMPPRYLNPTHEASTLQAKESAAKPYLWPFASITPDQYNNTLKEKDRAAIEAMAMMLLEARYDAEKYESPAHDTHQKSA